MAWINVTVPIRSGMVAYEGDPEVRLERVSSLAAGGICNLSRIELGVHSGTHLDAPVHFIEGAPGIEATPIDALVGRAIVVDARAITGDLDAAALSALGIPAGSERVLLRTRNSALWDRARFSQEFSGVTENGARYLVERGVRLVGIDYLSIAPFRDPAPTHLALLGAGVVVLEGLDLRSAEPGAYEMVCLPMLITGADGAPARVVLRR